MTREDVRAVLERVRDRFSYEHAVKIIREIGHANHLVSVDQSNFEAMHRRALSLLGEDAHLEIADGIVRAAIELQDSFTAFITAEKVMQTNKERLAAAVDAAVTEMQKAADFIKAHPAAADDPELGALADRLSNAATALGGVDTDPATSAGAGGTETGSGTVDNSGTDTGSGTVSG